MSDQKSPTINPEFFKVGDAQLAQAEFARQIQIMAGLGLSAAPAALTRQYTDLTLSAAARQIAGAVDLARFACTQQARMYQQVMQCLSGAGGEAMRSAREAALSARPAVAMLGRQAPCGSVESESDFVN